MNNMTKLIYGMLTLFILMVVGMLTSSWRVILYSYILIIGVSFLLDLPKMNGLRRSHFMIPISFTAVLLVLFIWIDFTFTHTPLNGKNYVFGLVPTTAVAFLGFWPLIIIATLIYAWTFPKSESTKIKSDLQGNQIKM